LAKRNPSQIGDKLKERLLKYREAVTTSSPTLPPGGYVGKRSVKGHNPIGVEAT